MTDDRPSSLALLRRATTGWPRLLPAAWVCAMLACLLVPLPTAAVDLLLSLSLAAALLLLVASLAVRQRAELLAFPSLLLLVTLSRLALNVATTRLILSQADAGRVIDAFAGLVVRGDIVVGAVMFAVITAVQFLVIARGSERVAEVAARFALDGLPGQQAAIDAVQYLLNRGHRRIALVNGDERHGYAHQRRQGWAAALARAGLAADPALVVNTRDISYAGGAAAAAVLLSQPEPPTAVFAVADALAIGVIKAMRRAGRRVPEDVAVVGFDDVPIAEVFEPGLTTIAQPMHALGAAAIDMLLERLAGGMPAHRVLPHRLVIRESA